ncbi:uL15 family ribosomal protein [Candidatus Kaiserbacteria bacterium]|nr:uL15 family ribosomal protein [Candidatus Kaiserbacteria bacterium]
MGLNTLKRYTTRPDVAVGRGGKRGKTSGRGTKGQNARAGHKKRPEIRDFIKKLPKRRGYGKNRARTVFTMRPRPVEVTLRALDKAFASGDSVNPKTLAEKRIIRGGAVAEVKILATGDISKKLIVSGCKISAGAKALIEKAGGSVE